MERFTVEGMSQDDGLSAMSQVARIGLVPFDLRAVDPKKSYVYDILYRRLGDVSVAQMDIANIISDRNESLARDVSEPQLVIQLPTGASKVEQNGRRVVTEAGAIAITWSLSAHRVTVEEPVFLDSITIPVDRLGLPHSLLRELMGRDIGASPLGATLRQYVRQLNEMPELPDGQGAVLATPTVDLVRALMTTAAGDEFASRGPLSQTIGMRIMLYLRSNLTDPSLTADLIAKRFNISRRYLYKILEELGVPLGEWVRTERLNLAAETLRDPARVAEPVAAISRQCGFLDHSSFSRAFRDHFGCTPTEWRVANGHSPSSGYITPTG